MLAMLASAFVGKPLHVLAVAAFFLAAHVMVRHKTPASMCPTIWLLIAAGLWTAYAAWEWAVLTRSPDANIRVDLLVIWPVLAVASLWALFRAIRSLTAAK